VLGGLSPTHIEAYRDNRRLAPGLQRASLKVLSLNRDLALLKHMFNLETAVGSQKSAQALGAPRKIKQCLITHKVATNFLISPCTPIPYASFLRPTAVSRFNYAVHEGWLEKNPVSRITLEKENNARDRV